MQTVLLIEDTPEVHILVKAAITGDQTRVVCLSSGEAALKYLRESTVHLILLDVGLPDISGFELCATIQDNKKTADIPIMILTGMNNIPYMVTAFTLGADDFITKPFNAIELKARVGAKLTKVRKRNEQGGSIRVADLHISPLHQKAYSTASAQEQDLGLTTLEFKLLFHLARANGQVFTREQLLNSIWGNKVHVMDRVVDTHICSLRKKLGIAAYVVESVPGVGYCFCRTPRSRSSGVKKSA